MRWRPDRLSAPPPESMIDSALVRALGFPATLIHGDTLVLDRWLWLRRKLSQPVSGTELVDVGCGSGAFTIGAAKLGYSALGLSWDDRNQAVAAERARLCRAEGAAFQVLDVRELHDRPALFSKFDVAVCCECIEHVLDDRSLLRGIAACLRDGGFLYLTTPYLGYRAITPDDDGPFLPIEDGRHVRRGYDERMLRQLCAEAGFVIQNVEYCSGFTSQKLTYVFRRLTRISKLLGWAAILPFRWLPPLVDSMIASAWRWPPFSICITARKASPSPPEATDDG